MDSLYAMRFVQRSMLDLADALAVHAEQRGYVFSAAGFCSSDLQAGARREGPAADPRRQGHVFGMDGNGVKVLWVGAGASWLPEAG